MKRKHINIFIQNTNQYFIQGLTTLLQSACLSRQATVTFLTQNSHYLADLMIVSNDTPLSDWECHPRTMNTNQSLLLIQDRFRYRTTPIILQKAGVIKYSDNTDIVLQLIDFVINILNDCATNRLQYCMPVLTPRELQVLSAIAQGVQPSLLAGQLGLHVKTISSHKCAAMRKLGFSRNQELYHWLRYQSGLVQSPINTLGSVLSH